MKKDDVPEALQHIHCAEYDLTAAIAGPELTQRRIALISTAGLMQQGDRPFSLGAVDYRILDTESDKPVMMSHISTNFDRSGFTQDHNIVLPLDRLKEKSEQGEIGSVARYHYSFMGATEPEKMQPAAEQLARTLKGDAVNGLILVPV